MYHHTRAVSCWAHKRTTASCLLASDRAQWTDSTATTANRRQDEARDITPTEYVIHVQHRHRRLTDDNALTCGTAGYSVTSLFLPSSAAFRSCEEHLATTFLLVSSIYIVHAWIRHKNCSALHTRQWDTFISCAIRRNETTAYISAQLHVCNHDKAMPMFVRDCSCQFWVNAENAKANHVGAGAHNANPEIMCKFYSLTI